VFGQVAAEGSAVDLALAEDELGLELACADELVGAAAADAEHGHDLSEVVEEGGVAVADAASALLALCGWGGGGWHAAIMYAHLRTRQATYAHLCTLYFLLVEGRCALLSGVTVGVTRC
jgi:hypothetical protein